MCDFNSWGLYKAIGQMAEIFNRLDLALWLVELAHIEAMLPWFQFWRCLKGNCKKNKQSNMSRFLVQNPEVLIAVAFNHYFLPTKSKTSGNDVGGLADLYPWRGWSGRPPKEWGWEYLSNLSNHWVTGISPFSVENEYTFILGPFSSQLCLFIGVYPCRFCWGKYWSPRTLHCSIDFSY